MFDHSSRSKKLVSALLFVVLATVVLCLWPLLVQALPSDLDLTFGQAGLVHLQDTSFSKMIVQPDGKIVVSFSRYYFEPPTGLVLKRFNADGTDDNAFGTGGKVVLDANQYPISAPAMVIQPDGKIVVGGLIKKSSDATSPDRADLWLARFNGDGSLDSGFGAGGIVTTDLDGHTEGFYDLAISPAGGLLLLGVSDNSSMVVASVILRYRANGSLDSSFGVAGKLTLPLNKASGKLAVGPDGDMVLVGNASRSRIMVARLNADGSPDLNFGTGGQTTVGYGNFDIVASGVAVQPDYKILLAETFTAPAAFPTLPSTKHIMMERLYPNGQSDGSFSSFTSYYTNQSSEEGGPLALGNGGWVMAGSVFPTWKSLLFEDIYMASSSGPRVTFLYLLPNVSSELEMGLGAGIQPDGRVVVGAMVTSLVAAPTEAVLYRYLGPLGILAKGFKFEAAHSYVTDGCTVAAVNVVRTGDTSGAATVDYATHDGSVTQRSSYTSTFGTLSFAPGQISQVVNVPITAEAYPQTGENYFYLELRNPTGGAGLEDPSSALVTINQNPLIQPDKNPIDDPETFVGQHYHDLLARQGEPEGLAYWTSRITSCGSDSLCIRQRRVDVSDAFFFETEYQETAGFVYRVFKASFNRQPAYDEFTYLRSNVIGGPDLEASKSSFLNRFVESSSFISQYPQSLTPEQYVDALNSHTANALSQSQRDALVGALKSGQETRATVLRKVADNGTFVDREYNNSFVQTLYFGYLRRDAEPGGFNFWLSQINRYPLRDVAGQHALVCSFITSREYQERFGSVVTHSNAECPQ